MRGLGAWIIPLGGIAGLVVGVVAAGILNSDCDTAAAAYWGCTHYNPSRLGLVGAGGGVFLAIFVWVPWHDDARRADEEPGHS